MSHDARNDRQGAGGVKRTDKKPYVPPRILLRENVEVIAADCTAGKTNPVDCSAVGVLQS